jgi:3-oxoacyl-[acyl-carrier protein] reductase
LETTATGGVDMNLLLDRRTALVTGSSNGIGAEIARVLAAEGANVVVHGLEADRTETVAAKIRDDGGRSDSVVADLGSDDGARLLARRAADVFGPVHILVNNVGVYTDTSWFGGTTDDWLDIYNVNVLSAVRLVRLLAPPMRDAGWGRIINISSGEAVRPLP